MKVGGKRIPQLTRSGKAFVVGSTLILGGPGLKGLWDLSVKTTSPLDKYILENTVLYNQANYARGKFPLGDGRDVYVTIDSMPHNDAYQSMLSAWENAGNRALANEPFSIHFFDNDAVKGDEMIRAYVVQPGNDAVDFALLATNGLVYYEDPELGEIPIGNFLDNSEDIDELRAIASSYLKAVFDDLVNGTNETNIHTELAEIRRQREVVEQMRVEQASFFYDDLPLAERYDLGGFTVAVEDDNEDKPEPKGVQ